MQLEECLKSKAEINVPSVVFKMEGIQEYSFVWDSPPFYTQDKGYKLYLKVSALYESCSYSSTSISVHVCLMHGEYDEDLIWPFRGTIEFELLNQKEDCDHKEGSARFMEKYTSKKNSKVSADEGRRTIGWGIDDLYDYSHEYNSFDEASDDGDKPEYIVDGTLYIKVSEASVTEYNKPWLT